MDAERHVTELLERFSQRKRPVRVLSKQSVWHQHFIAVLLKTLTLGGQRTYLTEYVTTLGHTIYVPDDFDTWSADRRCEILRHEAVHVAQFERFGWLGMILLYGLLPFPVVFAYGRARLEWQAYQESLCAIAELRGLAAIRAPALHDFIVARFTGPEYAWMWPFPTTVRRWIAETVEMLERTAGPSSRPRRESD